MNVAASMMVILGHSEVNMKVSDTGIENIESDDCREVLGDDRDANGILAVMYEKARFSYKDRQRLIVLFT